MGLFYYGSQDVPSPTAGRSAPVRRRSPRPPGICESCRRVITPEELRQRPSVELFGLDLCATCARRTRLEERIEIYFCDRCEVSVPVYRVDNGDALAGDGRILCVDCREQRRLPLIPVGIGLLSLVVLAAAGWLLHVESTEVRESPRMDREVATSLSEEIERLPDLSDTLSRVSRLREIRQASLDLATRRRRVGDRMSAIEKDLAGIRELAGGRLSSLEGATSRLSERLGGMGERLARVDDGGGSR